MNILDLLNLLDEVKSELARGTKYVVLLGVNDKPDLKVFAFNKDVERNVTLVLVPTEAVKFLLNFIPPTDQLVDSVSADNGYENLCIFPNKVVDLFNKVSNHLNGGSNEVRSEQTQV